ncbi:MAG: hypothetical protein ACRD8Z_10490 [Nitrososphaeraceae archaeon]
MNLDKLSKDLEKKYNDLLKDRSSIVHHFANSDEETEVLIKELEREQQLLDHLGDHHLVPIIKWKLKVGLETKIQVGRLFTKYGEDYENLTIEEEEWFRLLRKQDEAYGYDPKLDPNYKF